ncbi:hypothetical protein L6R29_12040 [Myxococcota bacterium]|nr:hypothetical protein [Myxococcota bacterium]
MSLPKDIGPYRIERIASESWAGPMFGGIELATQQPIFCLSLHADQFSWLSPAHWSQFRQSLEGSRLLNHPNILASYDIFHHTERHLRIFYKAPKPSTRRPETLHELLLARTQERLTERDALAAFEQIVVALASIHVQGHRMGLLPPDLFWLDWSKQPLRLRLSHYGLQSLLRGARWHELPYADHLLHYVAPDLCRDPDQPIQIHHDLYAAGALLWRILTGKPLLSAQQQSFSPEDLFWHEDLPPLQPVTLQLFERLLHPLPKKRYQNSHTLSAWLAGQDWVQLPSPHDPSQHELHRAAGTLSYASIPIESLSHLPPHPVHPPKQEIPAIQPAVWDLFLSSEKQQHRTEDLLSPFPQVQISLQDPISSNETPATDHLMTPFTPPEPQHTPFTPPSLQTIHPPTESLDNHLDAFLSHHDIPSQIPEAWEQEALAYDRTLERRPRRSPFRFLWWLLAVLLGWLLWRACF